MIKASQKLVSAIREFLRLESASGIILLFVAIVALVIDNSPFAIYYQALFQNPIAVELGEKTFNISITFIINDVLMVLFFLLVGLEIKREILIGELNSLAKISLPAIAAIGGMIVPALIYVVINHDSPSALRGWAIPTATDIAFALGVIMLLGRRIPASIKIYLTALAIFDDMGAIIIIAFFYNTHLSIIMLGLAALCFIALVLLNYYRINRLSPYLILGMLLWLFILHSGIHPTLVGVLLAFVIPMQVDKGEVSLLQRLEHKLHPWVAYGVIPLFGFANSGISFTGIDFKQLFTPVSLGIVAGLFIGKQLGVFSASWLAIKLRIAAMPRDANWLTLYGVALICGIGFTMSLFIGNLAFPTSDLIHTIWVRFGVLLASLLSGISGYLLLRFRFTAIK